MLLDRRVIQADYRNRAHQQRCSGHDQEQLFEGLALYHGMRAYLVNSTGLWYLERPDKPIRKTPMVKNSALAHS